MSINIQSLYSEGWSIDKVKLKFILPTLQYADNISFALSIDTRVVQDWVTNAIKQCHFNYNIQVGKNSFYVGLGSNGPKGSFQEKQKVLILEYNPNKVNPFKEFSIFHNLLYIPIHRRELMYFDLAYDMYLNINDISYVKRRSNEYECLISHNTLETIYLRSMGKNGSVRIYDKTLEQNGGINEDVDFETGEVKTVRNDFYGDLTRYEIRIKPGKDNNLNLLRMTPFTFNELCKLHNLSLKIPSDDDVIINLIKSFNTKTSQLLMLIHLGHSDLLSKQSIKKYRDLYYSLKEKALNNSYISTNSFDNFNNEKAFKCLCKYLESIQLDKNYDEFVFEI